MVRPAKGGVDTVHTYVCFIGVAMLGAWKHRKLLP
jgi:hypothetical protein